MTTETDLRRMLLESSTTFSAGEPAIDLAVVLRRSSRHRAVRKVVVGGVTTLAIAGIGVASIVGIRTIGGSSSTVSGAASMAGKSPTEGSGLSSRVAADRLNSCGAALASVAPAKSGLVVTANFVSTVASASQVFGMVTLANTGSKRIVGTSTARPSITLSQNGIALWHSNDPAILKLVVIDLKPGSSMTYPASFSPVRCGVADESASNFPHDLTSVGPGTYQVSAAIEVFGKGADALALPELVTGPRAEVILH